MKRFLCDIVYFAANKLTYKCRSYEEHMKLYGSFKKHFSLVSQNESKANEYERIMSQKDQLIEAVHAVKSESIETKKEILTLEIYIENIEDENNTMRSLLALLCKYRADGNYNKIDQILESISKQYLPNKTS